MFQVAGYKLQVTPLQLETCNLQQQEMNACVKALRNKSD